MSGLVFALSVWLVCVLLISAALGGGRVHEANPFELYKSTDDGGFLVPPDIARVLASMQAEFDADRERRRLLEDQYR